MRSCCACLLGSRHVARSARRQSGACAVVAGTASGPWAVSSARRRSLSARRRSGAPNDLVLVCVSSFVETLCARICATARRDEVCHAATHRPDKAKTPRGSGQSKTRAIGSTDHAVEAFEHRGQLLSRFRPPFAQELARPACVPLSPTEQLFKASTRLLLSPCPVLP